MDRSEILSFMNANPVCHLATVEGDTPHVRGMMPYRADGNGVIFHTGATKDLHKQLSKNPKVELCFNNFQDNVQVRVSGVAGLLEDIELKKEIVASREFLRPWVDQSGYEVFAVYRVKDCVATVWTMETNFAPKTYIEL